MSGEHSTVLARMPAQRGFTLIELLIAVVIVGVLITIAFPSYLESTRKGRRSDGVRALALVQQAQERWRSNNAAYTTTLPNTAPANLPANGLGLSPTTVSGYYTLAVDSADATSYTASVTARSGSGQENDLRCLVMGVQLAGGNARYGGGPSAIDWAAANPDPNGCWAK